MTGIRQGSNKSRQVEKLFASLFFQQGFQFLKFGTADAVRTAPDLAAFGFKISFAHAYR